MKKIFSHLLLVAFIVIGFTAQSWAFGSRHHHSGEQGDGSQGSGNSGQSDPSGNTPQGNNSGTDNNGSGSGSNSGGNGPTGFHCPDNAHCSPPKNFPAAPVPEPMTLSLLGTGLAGIFLKRKVS